MTRGARIAIGILVAMVFIGAIALPSLKRAVTRLSGSPNTEEQARREMLQAPISTPTDINVKAQVFWLAPGGTALQATTVELPLSADPVERSKQLLQTLIAKAPSADQRTLPPDATVLAFYLDPEGTAIADFSDELSQKMPSGILSEQLAIDSIVQTLGANVEPIQRLKILIHGQDVDTLAGHVDLGVLFPVPHATPQPPPNTSTVPGAATIPNAPATPGAPSSPAPAGSGAQPREAGTAKTPDSAPKPTPPASGNSATH